MILLQETGVKFPTIFSSTCACADVFPRCLFAIDLKIDNLDRVSIPTKIVATFDVEHPILGTTNEHPKSVNSGKITSALHVFYT